jgi:hypothetical protein
MGFLISPQNNSIAAFFYQALEHLDGERGLKLIPYRLAERMKLYLLNFIS